MRRPSISGICERSVSAFITTYIRTSRLRFPVADGDLQSALYRLRATCLLHLAQRLGYAPAPGRIDALVARNAAAAVIAEIARSEGRASEIGRAACRERVG